MMRHIGMTDKTDDETRDKTDDETRGHAGVAPWLMKPCNARRVSILSS
jgi:hypothetical protein